MFWEGISPPKNTNGFRLPHPSLAPLQENVREAPHHERRCDCSCQDVALAALVRPVNPAHHKLGAHVPQHHRDNQGHDERDGDDLGLNRRSRSPVAIDELRELAGLRSRHPPFLGREGARALLFL